MKKIISITLTAAMLLSCAGVSASAESSVPGYEVKLVEMYGDNDSNEPVEWSCLFRSDLPEIPFVDVEKYLGQIMTLDSAPKSEDGVYTFENDSYKMIVDPDKDTISFDFF